MGRASTGKKGRDRRGGTNTLLANLANIILPVMILLK
jgi:hypothetical protein